MFLSTPPSNMRRYVSTSAHFYFFFFELLLSFIKNPRFCIEFFTLFNSNNYIREPRTCMFSIIYRWNRWVVRMGMINANNLKTFFYRFFINFFKIIFLYHVSVMSPFKIFVLYRTDFNYPFFRVICADPKPTTFERITFFYQFLYKTKLIIINT